MKLISFTKIIIVMNDVMTLKLFKASVHWYIWLGVKIDTRL